MIVKTKKDLTRIKRALGRLLNNTGRIFNYHGSQPQKGSKALAEYSVFIRQKSIETAYRQADALIESAADHIFALTVFVKIVVALTNPIRHSSSHKGKFFLYALKGLK